MICGATTLDQLGRIAMCELQEGHSGFHHAKIKTEAGWDIHEWATAAPADPLPDPDRQQIGAFHRGAADTERESALLRWPRSGIDRRKVLDFLVSVEGATDEETMEATGLLRYTAAPRRNELLNDGWVEDSGKRRRVSSTHKRAIVWRVTEQGRREYERKSG